MTDKDRFAIIDAMGETSSKGIVEEYDMEATRAQIDTFIGRATQYMTDAVIDGLL